MPARIVMLRSHRIAYLALFAAFGAAFPLVATIEECLRTGAGVLAVHHGTPLMWLIDSAPPVLGAVGYLLGVERDANAALVGDLERMAREREGALQSAHGEIESLIASLLDAIVVTDQDGRIVRHNPAAERMLGARRDSLVGRRFADVVRGDDLALERVRRYGKAMRVELRRDDDSPLPVALSASSWNDAIGGIHTHVYLAHDVTREIEYERKLQAMMQCMPHFVVIATIDGTVTQTNQIIDEKHPEARGARLWDFVSNDQRSKVRSACRRCVEIMKPVSFETYACADNKFYRFANRVAPVYVNDRVIGLIMVKRDVTAEFEADQQQRRLAAAVDQASDSVIITDPLGTIVYVNPAFEAVSGYSADEAIGHTPALIKSGRQPAEVYDHLWRTISAGEVWHGRLENRARDGDVFVEEVTITPMLDKLGRVEYFLAVKRDITERLALEAQLAHSQKMESVGQLAAGIAHEINTPTQYVSDNTVFLQRAFGGLMNAIDAGRDVIDAAGRGEVDDATIKAARRAYRRAKLDFVREEVPRAIEQSLEGLERVSSIVSAMKEFSHPSDGSKELVDLAHAIETTVTVARNEWKYVAELSVEVAPDMPPVPCLRDELNQVLLNLIVNASHAIADVTRGGADGLGRIHIDVTTAGDHAEVRVRDSGAGIPPEIQQRIFDPFFTTKEVGKGTGQGLAIAHNVVVDKHGGTIDVESSPGAGTTFTIRLPLRDPPAEATEEVTDARLVC